MFDLGVNVHQVVLLDNRSNLEPVYFGALYTIMAGWLSLAARDRKARFRFWPDSVDRATLSNAHSVLAVRTR